MNPKRLWATAAAIFVLPAFGPHSYGVRAQNVMAVCRRGWEWVRPVQICSLEKDRGVMSAQVWIPLLVEQEISWARRLQYRFIIGRRMSWYR